MFTIYSKHQCSQCDQAKMLLDLKGVEYKTLTLGDDFTREELIEKVPTARSFPVVFKGEDLIGGLLELKKAI